MRILDRYIAKSIIVVFLCTLLIFFLLYLLIDSASQLDEFIDRKVPMGILLQYYLSFLPIIVVQTAFYAFLISTLLVYTNLNTHNEIIVLRSSGLNFFEITKPALALSILISVCVFFVNEHFVPMAETRSKQLRQDYMVIKEGGGAKHPNSPINNLTFYGLKNRLYFIDSFDPNTYALKGITIVGFDENQNITEKIVALEGIWTGIAWKFIQCQITTFFETTNNPTKVKVYPEKLLDIKETPEEFLQQRVNPGTMNIKQLNEYISRFKSSGADRVTDNLTIDLYQKFTFPFSNIIIILVGLPLALMTGKRRAQSFLALGIAIAIGFFYHLSNVVMIALGKGGLLSPILAVTAAPLIFLGIAFYLIKTRS